MPCDACGSDLALRAKFCSECGEPVARASSANVAVAPAPGSTRPTPVDGERRQLTVLFSDLVGSTAMASRLDPEDWREVVSAYQEACSVAVGRFGGYVAQYLGDGLVVYFGYPTAHEDDALRATRAGLALIEALTCLEPRLARHGVELAARVGVHTGTVVVGEVGATARKETLAHGDTTNLAARLQELAAPNTVVLSHATFRLVGGHFVTEERGMHTLKGIAKPVAVYRAVRPVRVRSTIGAGDGAGESPILGRQQEVRLILDRWDLSTERAGQCVVLSGEAGIGKSRVALAVRQELAHRPHTWLECPGSSDMQDTPLHPIVVLQEEALGLASFDRPEQKIAQLERALVQAGLSPTEHLPPLTDLHSLPPPPRYQSVSLSPEARRRRTLDSLVEWFCRLSDEQPLVVLVEDLHWIDPTTLELLGRLVERSTTRRMMLLMTHRPGFQPPWASGSQVTPIVLSRLTRSDATTLVRHVASRRGHLPDDVVRAIVNRSDGVPLFVEELTKSVLDAEAERSGEGPLRPVVPSTLQDSLMARLDQLGPAKELAQHCATVGREFSLELVRATAPLDASALDEALARLVGAELLQRRGEPPVYSFRHALVQEQAYESLLKTTRHDYHRKIAETLSTKFPQTALGQPEVLAHHYDEGGQYEQAVGFWLESGQKAIARSANIEASRQLQRGLDSLARLPASAERAQHELLLLTMRGVVLIALRGYAAEEVERTFARARAICQELGDTPHLFPVLFGLFLYYMVRGDGASTEALVHQLETTASGVGDSEFTLEAHTARAAISYWEGRFTTCQAHILKARVLYDPARHRHHPLVYGQDPLAYGYCYGALTLWFLGYPDQALESANRALDLAERANHPLTLAGILSFVADLHYHLGDPAAVAAVTERMLAVAEQQGLALWSAWGRSMLGSARFQLGDPEGGIEDIRAGAAAFLLTGAKVNAPYLKARLAEAYLGTGRVTDGIETVDDALRSLETQLDRYFESELHRLRGRLLRCLPDPDLVLAEQSFQRALEVARAQSARSLELRAAMDLGRLWSDLGKHDAARRLVASVHGWFTEGLSTRDLVDAKALLHAWRVPGAPG